jgi:RNA polymerase sigma-70 factor (sigma-E family)
VVVVVVEQDFAALVASRYERLRHAAYVLCGSLDAADDLVQTALARAVRSRARVEAADDVDAYLHVMLVNTYRTGLRRLWSGERSSGLSPAGESPKPSADAAERLDVHAALMRLSPSHRKVLVLRFMADMSESETAQALGCTVGTVKSRTSRALTALRGDKTAQRALARGD